MAQAAIASAGTLSQRLTDLESAQGAEVSFSQEYTDPKIHIQLEHLKRLPVLFLTLNLSAKTSRGVFVRSNMAKEKIDVEYSVYLYVEEMADT